MRKIVLGALLVLTAGCTQKPANQIIVNPPPPNPFEVSISPNLMAERIQAGVRKCAQGTHQTTMSLTPDAFSGQIHLWTVTNSGLVPAQITLSPSQRGSLVELSDGTNYEIVNRLKAWSANNFICRGQPNP